MTTKNPLVIAPRCGPGLDRVVATAKSARVGTRPQPRACGRGSSLEALAYTVGVLEEPAWRRALHAFPDVLALVVVIVAAVLLAGVCGW